MIIIGLNYLDLETYDMYWAKVRDMYRPFESGFIFILLFFILL